MKKMTRTLSIGLIICALIPAIVFASKKSEAKLEIQDAFKLMKKIVAYKSLQKFIPYDSYYNSKIYLAEAKHQFEEEDNYEVASLYAILALVELETTLAIAKTRYAVNEKLIIERDYFKNVASNASRKATLKIAIAEANLQKIGRSYQGVLLDSSIFKRRTYVLNDKGKKALEHIYNVMNLYRRSKITIIGHTRWRDSTNNRSMKKAESVSSFLTTIKGLSSGRVNVKGMGRDKPMDINGRMRHIDRVEIILTGIR